MSSLLSLEGRTKRMGYVGFIIAWVAIIVGLTAFSLFVFPIMTAPIYLVLLLLMFVTSIAVAVRRLHDMGISGWAMLFIFVISIISTGMAYALAYPPYGPQLTEYFIANPSSAQIYLIAMTGMAIFVQFSQSLLIFWPGDEGPNRFG